MDSSISRSKLRLPKVAAGLALVAMAAWAAAAYYSLKLNPEIRFCLAADTVKRAWIRKLETAEKGKVVIFGGSSCATSIQAARLQTKHHIPAANLGLVAGLGAQVLSRYARSEIHPGDTLIVALEPDLLTGSLTTPSLGIQFSLAAHQPEWLGNTGPRPWPGALLALRPGAYHCLTFAVKALAQQPLYRYAHEDWHPDGWLEVRRRTEFPSLPLTETRLSSDGREWLQHLSRQAAVGGFRIAYSLPWSYVNESGAITYQRIHSAFLSEVAETMPVLRDETLGAITERALFADTNYHLTAAGAERRTDSLATQFTTWATWTAEELRRRRAGKDAEGDASR